MRIAEELGVDADVVNYIKQPLDEATLRERLAVAARQLIELEFDAERTSARIREIFTACRQSTPWNCLSTNCAWPKRQQHQEARKNECDNGLAIREAAPLARE